MKRFKRDCPSYGKKNDCKQTKSDSARKKKWRTKKWPKKKKTGKFLLLERDEQEDLEGKCYLK